MQIKLNDLKYELMVLNQTLGTVVPASNLADELLAQREALQNEITRLENELKEKPAEVNAVVDQSVKKVLDEEGRVRIWSSSSSES